MSAGRGGVVGGTRRRVRASGVYTPCGKVGVRENKTALKRGLEGGSGGLGKCNQLSLKKSESRFLM